MFLGYHLAPGGHWQGDYLVADLEDLMNVKDQNVRIYRIKEVTLPAEGPTFPLRTARIAVNQRRLGENIGSRHLDDAEPTSDVEDRDGLTTADAIEDGTANGLVHHVRDGVTLDDGEVEEDDPEVEHEAPERVRIWSGSRGHRAFTFPVYARLRVSLRCTWILTWGPSLIRRTPRLLTR